MMKFFFRLLCFILFMYKFEKHCLADLVPTINKYVISSSLSPTPGNPIVEDTKCNVKQVENANDSQLYMILEELKKTIFFRSFIVDLEQKCPLSGWRKKSSLKEDDDEEEIQCASEGIPDLEEGACDIDSSSNDLLNIFERNGFHTKGESQWDSESEEKTFSWQQPSDPVIKSSTNFKTSEDCDERKEDNLLPDTFWIDICSEIKVGDGMNVVNLELNPERNTGYNGTHIWKAIYDENCFLMESFECYEERVLYRLLSGMHTSTTISIATNYFAPSKRKNRTEWEANPVYFMEKLEHNAEHIRNLHFSYLVLLRALRKAAPFLYEYEIRTGNILDDEKATVMLKRLLDTHIFQSCHALFEAFDESMMFQDRKRLNTISLQHNFKGVFHNISSILDCVQCQQCKLHGKMTMLGYGTALKILFSKEEIIPSSITRNEIVAFINTIAKFSTSLKEVRMLSNLYWKTRSSMILDNDSPRKDDDYIEMAIKSFVELSKLGKITTEEEVQLVELALKHDSNLLQLTKYYNSNLEKYLLHLKSLLNLQLQSVDSVDAIIIGSGLAGLVTALSIVDRGGRVVVIEKEHVIGGNSAKASSGINGCCFDDNDDNDTMDSFRQDVVRSAGSSAQLPLIETLTENSAEALEFLKSRVGIDLSMKAQLGGHSHKRTHRPNNGMVGAEVIYGMQKALKKYEKAEIIRFLMDSKVIKILQSIDKKQVIGVSFQNTITNATENLTSSSIVLATGGFAADRSKLSYLNLYRPELVKIPATAGTFSTGDGITLAKEVDATTIDMDKVQIHPTGWIDPTDPNATQKILAAELMRGVGGILLNTKGKRFCNELGTRAYVTEQMFVQADASYQTTKLWNVSNTLPPFYLVLSNQSANDARKHVDLYTHKRLLQPCQGIHSLASFMNTSSESLTNTYRLYEKEASKSKDAFGKTTFRGVTIAKNLKYELFYVGKVTPVLHYCMGGISIDTQGHVLDSFNQPIQGLYAAGEVSGGVHGFNRLGGNSLLECTVFGLRVGRNIPISEKKIGNNYNTQSISDTQQTSSIQQNNFVKTI